MRLVVLSVYNSYFDFSRFNGNVFNQWIIDDVKDLTWRTVHICSKVDLLHHANGIEGDKNLTHLSVINPSHISITQEL